MLINAATPPFLLILALCMFLLLGGCDNPFAPKEENEAPPPVRPFELVEPGVNPDPVGQGKEALFTVFAYAPDSTVQQVTADFSALGGTATDALYDDGTHGDAASGDGVWTLRLTIPGDAPTGHQDVVFSGVDDKGDVSSASCDFQVTYNQRPVLSAAALSRDPVAPGGMVLITVHAVDPDGTVQSVTVDLADMGITSTAPMYDDGTHGDVSSGDGTYSFSVMVSETASPGAGKTLTFEAEDDALGTATDTLTFEVSSNVAPKMENAQVSPANQVQQLSVTISVKVTDTDGLTSVTVDLSPLGGPAAYALLDPPTVDDVYSATYVLPAAATPGAHVLTLTATDALSETNYTTVNLWVEANDPPVISGPACSADPTPRNKTVTFTATVTDIDGTVTSVVLDLSAFAGGTSTEAMYDDGTHGDAAAGDDLYSLQWTITAADPVGLQNLSLTAVDDDNVPAVDTLSFTTLSNVAPVLANPASTPDPQEVGLQIALTVDVSDDGTVSSVTGDLRAIGGSASEPFYDDGAHGDGANQDGTWGCLHTHGGAISTGTFAIPVTATDDQAASNGTSISVTVNANSAPTLSSAAVSDQYVQPGQTTTVTVSASDLHGITGVTADLSPFGRSSTQALYDDGTHGDATGTDGVWSYQFTPAALAAPGGQTIQLTGTDGLGLTGTASTTLNVVRFRLEHAAFLEDIHGTSSSNIYTVGEFNQVYRYDGSAWRAMAPRPGSSESWWAVWCVSASSVWIGGASGHVSHFDGSDWSDRDPSGVSGYTIRAIWEDGSGTVWAVGGLPGARETSGRNDHDSDDGYCLLSWTSSGGWSTPTTGNNDDLNAVFGVSASDVVAVGDDGLIMHYNGTSWSSSNSLSTVDDLFGVWGYNDGTNSHYWAVAGRNSGTATPNIYHYSSTAGSWSQVSSMPSQTINLKGIYGSVTNNSLNAVYVTGTMDFSLIHGSVWESTDGQNFTQLANANPPFPYSASYFPYAPTRLFLSDVWMDAGASDVWITGRRSIQHYTPSATPPWTEDSRGTYEDTRGVDVLSGTRAITWDYPKRPGSTGTQVSSIVHEYASATWNEHRDTTGSVGPALETHAMLDPPGGSQGAICPRMYAVKMFSSTDVYGVGDDGHVYHWDGQNLVGHDFTSQKQYGVSPTDQRRLYAIWGTSATDFWFGGEGNRIYHYQGTNWSTNAPTATILPGTARVVTGIWGSGNSDVYAVAADTGVGTRTANRGDIWHYNGSIWASIAGSSGLPATGALANLNAIWGTSSSDVTVVGDGGSAWHYDGSAWSSLATALGSPSADLAAVFGDGSQQELFIAGGDMRVWFKKGSTWNALRVNGSSAAFMGGDTDSGFTLLAGTKGITLRLEK